MNYSRDESAQPLPTTIEVLDGLEAIRVRPLMYVGALDERGLHHLVEELVQNSVAEFRAGYASTIQITINADGTITVEDDGRGIPTELSGKTGLSGIEMVFTTMGCPTGIGATVVNALSTTLEVAVFRNGMTYRKRYERGKPISPLESEGASNKTGTRVTFAPDLSILCEVDRQKNSATNNLDWSILVERLRELAFLNKHLRIVLTNNRTGKLTEFLSNLGVAGYANWLTGDRKTFAPIMLEGTREHGLGNRKPEFFLDRTVAIECALQWYQERGMAEDRCKSLLFVNLFTHEDTTLLESFDEALASTLNSLDHKQYGFAQPFRFSAKDVRRKLTSVVSLRLNTFLRMIEKGEIDRLMSAFLAEELKDWAGKNPAAIAQILTCISEGTTG